MGKRNRRCQFFGNIKKELVQKRERIKNPKKKAHVSNFKKQIGLASLLFTLIFCSETREHGFDRGKSPVWTNPKTLASAETCQSCHQEIYDEWRGSRHRVAFTNALYQESHDREPLQWCENCHAPLVAQETDPNKKQNRLLSEEGVSCNVCHVREGKILTSKRPISAKEHEYKEVSQMRGSDFCANCHQFHFPVGTGAIPHELLSFSELPMQNTYDEWQTSKFGGKETCQDCHMTAKQGRRTHSFPGGHSLSVLSDSVSVSFLKTEDSHFLIWRGKGIGHSFPTGDLFRTLVIRFLDKEGRVLGQEKLGYVYGKRSNPGTKDSAKELKEKMVLLPPLQRDASELRQWLSPEKLGLDKATQYSLHIRYLSEEHSLETKLKTSEYMPKFKSGKIEWGN